MGVVRYLLLSLVVRVIISDQWTPPKDYWMPKAKVPSFEDIPSNRVIVCQYDRFYRKMQSPNFQLSGTEMYHCTHIVWNSYITLGGTIKHWEPPPYKDQQAIISWKTRTRQPMKTLISIRLLDTEAHIIAGNMDRFFDSLEKYLRQYKFDGVEIDSTYLTWEKPKDSMDVRGRLDPPWLQSWVEKKKPRVKIYWYLHYLWAALKERINKTKQPWLMTCVVRQSEAERYDVPIITSRCDFVVVQTIVKPTDVKPRYSWSGYHLIHPSPTQMPDHQFNDYQHSVNWSVNWWLVHGLPANKLVVAIPTYGLNFLVESKNKENNRVDLGDPAVKLVMWSEPGQDKVETMNGYVPYFWICKNRRYDYRFDRRYLLYNNNKGLASGAIAVGDNHWDNKKYFNWIGYDDFLTVWNGKVDMINKYHLRGAKVYSIQFDDYNGSFCKFSGKRFPTSYFLTEGIIKGRMNSKNYGSKVSSASTMTSSVVLLAMVVTLEVMWMATPE